MTERGDIALVTGATGNAAYLTHPAAESPDRAS